MLQVKEKEFVARMGLSSSQARLLHLTSRMHQIEYKAAKIEAEKLQLANDSDEAYSLYLEKLEQTKLVANVLSNNGSMTTIDLTAGVIYDFKKLPEQYSLETKDNKALIPADVSTNYRNTNSLSDFLKAYNLETSYTQTIHHEDPNPTYATQGEQYRNAVENWENSCRNIDEQNQQRLDAWKQRREDNEEEYRNYLREHANWVPLEPDPDDHDQPWWTTTADDSLATKFTTAGSSCYNSAKGGYFTCYAHVLAHIIDFSDGKGKGSGKSPNAAWYDGTNNLITTTTGSTIAIDKSDITSAGMNNETNNATMAEVSEKIDDETIKPGISDGETCDVSSGSNEYQKLVSKWDYRTGELKSQKQWAKDLYYICKQSGSITGYDAENFKTSVTKFNDSLKNSLTEFNQEVYDQYHERWVEDEPKRPDEFNEPMPEKIPYPPRPKEEDYVTAPPTLPRDEIVNHTTFNDKAKAQWYINLWYKMEGEDKTPRIMETLVHDDATNTNSYIYSCENKNKSNAPYSTNADWNVTENENYMEIPADKINDPKWLRNAIVEGYVVIQAFDQEANEFKDSSVSITTRIDEVQDETGLKKAEAEYEASLLKIDKKDRYYDKQLAALETERNATKEEMEALKTVAKDNVDRTFKLFS